MRHADRELVRALHNKYLELKGLREEGETACTERPPNAGPAHGARARADMAALAARFPGALRELDRLPMSEIDARLRMLSAALESGAPLPEWASWQIALHGSLRAALRIRRLARGGGSPAEALARVRAGYTAASDEPPLACLDAAFVAGVVTPPDGRLTNWAIERVAAGGGVAPSAVEAAVFGQKADDFRRS
jgi:hypothetical protein